MIPLTSDKKSLRRRLKRSRVEITLAIAVTIAACLLLFLAATSQGSEKADGGMLSPITLAGLFNSSSQ